jgi:hypothetical protein
LLADRVGFELAVRSEKLAFEFSAEFRASLARFGFRENFAREVLDESIRLVFAVRFQRAAIGLLPSKEAAIVA